MEQEDFLVRPSSIDLNASILPEVNGPAVQAVTTKILIPRSSSLEELAQYTQTEVPVIARPVFTQPQLAQFQRAMEESFQVTFHHSREIVRHTVSIKMGEDLRVSLCQSNPLFREISKMEYAVLIDGLMKNALPLPFKTKEDMKDRLSEEPIAKMSEFLSVDTFLTLYDQFLRGGDLYRDTKKNLIFQLGSMIFVRRLSPIFFAVHFSNLSSEVFDFAFKEYQSESLLCRIKNAMILYHICLEVYGKLMCDIVRCYKSVLFSQKLNICMDSAILNLIMKGSPNMKNVILSLEACLQKSQDPEAESEKFLVDFDRHFKAYKESVRDIKTHALNFDYIAFYLSKHESAQAALEDTQVFPQNILSEFVQSRSMNADEIKRLVSVDGAYVLETRSTLSQEIYYSRSNFFLAWDQCNFFARISFLEKKLKSVRVKQLKDSLSIETHQAVQTLLLKLKTMDLASPAYKMKDINAIHDDLKTLEHLIENFQSIVSLVKEGLIPAIKPVAKKSAPKRKPKKKKTATPIIEPIVVPKVSVLVPVVVPKKAVPSENSELRQISEISQRITQNIEKEKQYYKTAKDYIVSLMTNAQAKGLVEELFNPKSNLKNILSQKDMTLIVDQMSSKIDAVSENLKGSNGFRFRVEDVIYTCHASTAEVGHNGHGGAIKAFRDFLIAVYRLSLGD